MKNESATTAAASTTADGVEIEIGEVDEVTSRTVIWH
jgi:hypothetical protein